jgi:hypothetical protein
MESDYQVRGDTLEDRRKGDIKMIYMAVDVQTSLYETP